MRRLCAGVLLALAVMACDPTNPSGSPPASDVVAPPAFVLGCLSIEQPECEFVAGRVRAELPDGRGAPFALMIQLYGCPNMDPCPQSLAFREGKVTVEWADPDEPLELSVKGPREAPVFGEVPMAWSGLQNPSSPRVAGAGPFPFELGHCGLTWQVDFDGSFWLPIGQVDGDASPIINSDSGQMRLLAPNLAEYRNSNGFAVQLVRFPGPKHVWLCA